MVINDQEEPQVEAGLQLSQLVRQQAADQIVVPKVGQYDCSGVSLRVIGVLTGKPDSPDTYDP